MHARSLSSAPTSPRRTLAASRLATQLARLTGESLTAAVTLALRKRLARECRRRKGDAIAEAVAKIQEILRTERPKASP